MDGVIVVGAVAFFLSRFALATHAVGERYTHVGEYIVGGSNAAVNEYPWQIMLKKGGAFQCGGTILTRRYILTAAHCIGGSHDEYSVVAGEHDIRSESGTEQEVGAKIIFVHSRFDRYTLKHDIAIVKLATRLNYTASVRPVKLSYDSFDNYAAKSENCWSTGFGTSSQNPNTLPKILQEMKTNIIPNSECNDLLWPWGYSVHVRNVCVKDDRKSVCFGDSGGPLGCYDKTGVYRQVGITSWGPSGDCIEGPSVFTRVSKYRKWIRQTMLL